MAALSMTQEFVRSVPSRYIENPCYSSCEILQSRIKSKSFVEAGRHINYLGKVTPERISGIRIGFCDS